MVELDSDVAMLNLCKLITNRKLITGNVVRMFHFNPIIYCNIIVYGNQITYSYLMIKDDQIIFRGMIIYDDVMI